MATALEPTVRLNSERRFFLGMAAAMAVCTFVGFARSYYLMRWTGSPALAGLVHLHGLLFTGWVLLFGAQAGLISARRHDLHRLTGAAGAFLAAGMVVLGLFIALTRSTPPPRAPFNTEQFLAFPIVSISLFAIFVALAFANRHRPDHHKRYMLIATVNVIIPALARVTFVLTFLPPGVLGGMLIMNLFLLALLIYDWRSLGRIHRATLIGVGITLVSEPLRFLVATSDWWPPIARSLML